ncbi:MAG TPA: hypothetical protein PLA83_07615 [Deltaproteobacteria bacterium]|nr:hypothetical protein [Deltaproteobacteria bacterium]HQI00154.1 hypothetical protein [Deltaproteobacteria bacterium]HQJ07444.1 hypothetical protein [Deltaproteobacteria bacterium]
MEESDPRVIESGPLPYMLSIPIAHKIEAGPLPVICFLHGYDEAAPLPIQRGVTRHGPLRRGSSRTAVRECIIIAPQLPYPGDIWHLFADAVRQIVTQVREAYRGDPDRTYLTGFSFGGNGVLDLPLVQRDFWAALWPVDPTRVPTSDPGRPLWLSFGEVSRRRKEAFIRALNLTHAGASAHGNRLYLDEGQDHVSSAELAYRDEKIYSWLLSKSLASAV